MPDLLRVHRRLIPPELETPEPVVHVHPEPVVQEAAPEPEFDDPDVTVEWIKNSLIALGLLEQRPLCEWKRVRQGDRVILSRPYIPGEPDIVIPKKGGYVVYDPASLHAQAEYITPEQFERDYVK